MHNKDQLTPLRRRLAIEEGRPVDRPVVVLFTPDLKAQLSNRPIYDLYHDPQAMIESELAAYERWGMDWVHVGPNSKGLAQSLGVEIHYPEDAPPQLVGHPLEAYEDLDRFIGLPVEEDPHLNKFYEAAAGLAERIGDEVNIGVALGGTLTIASYLRGTEKVLRDTRRNREGLEALLDLVLNRQKEVVRYFSQIPGIRFNLADPVASGSLISPKLFEQLILPRMKDLVNYIVQESGRRPTLHMCGKMEVIWPFIKELDLDHFSIDNASNLEEACAYFGDKFQVAGNVPPVEVIAQGDAASIHQSVQEKLAEGGHDPSRHVLAFGCDAPLMTPLENIDAFMDAVRKYAK